VRSFRRGLVLAALAALVTAACALAGDDGRHAGVDPGIREWIRTLANQNGEGCCDTADGYPAEAEWDTTGRGYRVLIDGRWWPVPDYAVITKPNRLGYPVVWYWRRFDGEPQIRCFIPGSGS
jgi:hypothetical protein